MDKLTLIQLDAYRVGEAIEHLRSARELLAQAKCPRATDKVRRAMKSAEGALRNVSVRQWRHD